MSAAGGAMIKPAQKCAVCDGFGHGRRVADAIASLCPRHRRQWRQWRCIRRITKKEKP